MPLFATPIERYHKDNTLSLDDLVGQLKRGTVNSLHQNPEVVNGRYQYPKPEAMLHVLARSRELGIPDQTKKNIDTLLDIQGADINVHFKQSRKDKKAGRSPLVEAVRAGNHWLALYFIEKGADVKLLYGNVFGEEEGAGYNVLHTAASRGYSEIIKAALSKVKKGDRKKFVNQADTNGWTPLHDAAKTGNLASVNLLIAAGANLKQKAGGSQRTPIEFALERLQNAEANFDVSQPNTVQELQQATAIVAALAKADKAWQMTIEHKEVTKPLWQFLVDLWKKLVDLCHANKGPFDRQLALSQLINDIVQAVGFKGFDTYIQGVEPKIIPLLEIVHFMTAAATAPAAQPTSPGDPSSSSNTATSRSSANEVDILAVQLVIFLGHEGVAWDQQIVISSGEDEESTTTKPLWEMALDIIGTGKVNVQLVSNIINSKVGLDAVEHYTNTKGYSVTNAFVVDLKTSLEAAKKEKEESQKPQTKAERDAASSEALTRGGVGTKFIDSRIQETAKNVHKRVEANLHPL